MKVREPLIHTLIWLAAMAMCYLGQTIRFGNLQYGSGAMLLLIGFGTFYHVVVFYSAAFRHVPLWRMGRWLRSVLELVGLMSLAVVLKSALLYWVFLTFRSGEDPWRIFDPILIVAQALMVLVMFTFGYSYRVIRDQREYERSRQQLEYERTNSELSYLKTQVNPHFLFNTLNNLFGLANREGAEATAESILKLAELMRYQLHDANDEVVDLDLEIDNLNNFVDLQRLRISKKHDVRIAFEQEGSTLGVQVPPMLFLPLVENAFKYGVSYKAPSEIWMKLVVAPERLSFVVENTVHHKDHQQEHTSGGIGLENLNRRLSLLYHGEDLFHYEERENRFRAELVLPLHQSAGRLALVHKREATA